MAIKDASKGYGNYKGKAPAGVVTQVKDLNGKIRSYASYKKTEVEQQASASIYLAMKKSYSEAKSLATSNNGSTRTPFGSNATDQQGDNIRGDSLLTFNNSWLGHDGNAMQMFPEDSSGNMYSLVNEEYGWRYSFDTTKLPDNMGVFRNVNAPTKVTIQAGADGYVQNFAFVGSGKSAVAWNSSTMINDTASTHYYTSQDNIRVSAVLSGGRWFNARLLVWFDTSSIPSGKTIKKVKVRLKLKSHVVSQTDYGEILKIYEWDEFAPGGRITTVDYDGFDIAGGTVDMTNVSNGDWIEFDITGDLLANFQSNYSNSSPSHGYGFMVRNRYDFDGASLTPTGLNYHWFHSAEASDSSYKPELVVSYE